MRQVAVILIGFFAATASTYGVVWLLYENPGRNKDLTAEELLAQDTPEDALPELSKTGKHPKVLLDESSSFEFGRMEVGEKRTHTFVIKNVGEGPLVLKQGKTTCQCTVSTVNDKPIQPGESGEVTLTWEPIAEAEEFHKTAEIYTNDPEKRNLVLGIKGVVTTRLTVYPGNTWEVTQFREDGDTDVVGVIASPIEESFKITSVESEQPYVSLAECVKIEDPQRLSSASALCAYEVHLKVHPTMPVGSFAAKLNITTDIVGKKGEPLVKAVMIAGNRRGPIRISGEEWVETISGIAMRSFKRSEGKTVQVKLLVKHPPENGLEITELKTDPDVLKVTITPDAKVNEVFARYLLTVEYPPGLPPMTRAEMNPGSIHIRTNHPTAPDIQLKVFLSSY